MLLLVLGIFLSVDAACIKNGFQKKRRKEESKKIKKNQKKKDYIECDHRKKQTSKILCHQSVQSRVKRNKVYPMNNKSLKISLSCWMIMCGNRFGTCSTYRYSPVGIPLSMTSGSTPRTLNHVTHSRLSHT